MTDKVKIVWLSHLKDKEDREGMKQRVLAQYEIWDRLRQIMEDKLESKEMSYQDYDSPSWSHKQAHANGYREALLEMYDLLP